MVLHGSGLPSGVSPAEHTVCSFKLKFNVTCVHTWKLDVCPVYSPGQSEQHKRATHGDAGSV